MQTKSCTGFANAWHERWSRFTYFMACMVLGFLIFFSGVRDFCLYSLCACGLFIFHYLIFSFVAAAVHCSLVASFNPQVGHKVRVSVKCGRQALLKVSSNQLRYHCFLLPPLQHYIIYSFCYFSCRITHNFVSYFAEERRMPLGSPPLPHL